MKKLHYKIIIFFLYIYSIFSSHSASQGPKESALWKKMQSRIPIINPLELDSPFVPGMGHDMMEEVEKIAVTDTNMGTNPIFPMRSGYDSNLNFGIVGKILPNDLIQWGRAQKGRIPYAIKIAQDIGNKVKANIAAKIPSIKLPEQITNNNDNILKISDKIDFQVEDTLPSAPVTPSGGSLLDKGKNTLKEQANNIKDKIHDKLNNLTGAMGSVNDEVKKLDNKIFINQHRKA